MKQWPFPNSWWISYQGTFSLIHLWYLSWCLNGKLITLSSGLFSPTSLFPFPFPTNKQWRIVTPLYSSEFWKLFIFQCECGCSFSPSKTAWSWLIDLSASRPQSHAGILAYFIFSAHSVFIFWFFVFKFLLCRFKVNSRSSCANGGIKNIWASHTNRGLCLEKTVQSTMSLSYHCLKKTVQKGKHLPTRMV